MLETVIRVISPRNRHLFAPLAGESDTIGDISPEIQTTCTLAVWSFSAIFTLIFVGFHCVFFTGL